MGSSEREEGWGVSEREGDHDATDGRQECRSDRRSCDSLAAPESCGGLFLHQVLRPSEISATQDRSTPEVSMSMLFHAKVLCFLRMEIESARAMDCKLASYTY